MTSPEESLETLVRGAFSGRGAGGFRPCALYDEPLDCIRVFSRDCSVTEIRINSLITVLEENYPASGSSRKYVGFTINGARHFCKENGLDLATPIKLTEILDKIFASSPTLLIRMFVDGFARPLVEEQNIKTVDLSKAA